MKKQHFYLCLLASMLGMMTTGCSDETTQTDTPTAPDEDGRITVTASAGMPQGGASTRLGFNEETDDNKLLITWNATGETFSVLGGTESATPSLFTQMAVDATDKHKANFTGQINADESTTYYAVYPEITGNTAVAATSISLDMTGQTGTAFDEKKTYMYATSGYDAASNALAFNFNHLTSILRVTLKFTLPVNASGTVHDMTKQELTRAATNETAGEVTFTADGLMSKASVDITKTPTDNILPTNAYTSEESGTLSLSGTFTLTNSGSNVYSTTVYLHVLPGTLNNLEVKAKVNGTEYSCKLSDQTTLEAGKMYTVSDANMVASTSAFTVNTKIDDYNVTYHYNVLNMQFGTDDSTTPITTAMITDGKATFSANLNDYVNKTIWVCIPKVAKFFHKVTQDEADKGILELPNKDKGSTLKTTLVAGDKPYENDWIVALYIGINKDGSNTNDTPIYWATGNLIAIKTNAANSGATEAAFHIASKSEATTMQSDANKSIPESTTYDGDEGTDDYKDLTKGLDGYQACAAGSRWDRFGWGDASGLMTALNYKKYAAKGEYDPVQYGNNATWLSISGKTEYDIARAKLGGSWRLPAGGNSTNNGKGEFRTFIDDTRFDKTTGNYTYTVYADNGESITNTIWLPYTGDRNGTTVENVNEGCYWSGVALVPALTGSADDKSWRARGIRFNATTQMTSTEFTRKSGRAIRPVTE